METDQVVTACGVQVRGGDNADVLVRAATQHAPDTPSTAEGHAGASTIRASSGGTARREVRGWLAPLGLGQRRREVLEAGIRRLGGRVVKSAQEASHVVVAESVPRERREGLLRAAGAGGTSAPSGELPSLVACDWLAASIVAGHFLDAARFELPLRAAKRPRTVKEEAEEDQVPAQVKQELAATPAVTASQPAATLRARATAGATGPPIAPGHEAPKALLGSDAILSLVETDSLPEPHAQAEQGGSGTCLNPELLDEFETLRAHYAAHKTEKWRESLYRKVVAAIKALPFRIRSLEDLSRPEATILRGASTKSKVQEFLELGSIPLAKQVQQDPRSKGIYELMNFGMEAGKKKYASYVGAATAARWFDSGITSVSELAKRIETDPSFLTHNQKVMWDFRHDFARRIPRAEVDVVARIVMSAFHPADTVEVCGSYRKGAALCGDVDLLVSVEGNPHHVCVDAVDKLTQAGLITSTLRSSHGANGAAGQWQGGCCLALTGHPELAAYTCHHRMDIKVYPKKERAFALLYFGSGEAFNRAIRLLATRHGYALTDHGIRRECRAHNTLGELVTIWEGPFIEDPTGEGWATEASIFAFLGLPYIPPQNRGPDVTVTQLEQLASGVPSPRPTPRAPAETSWRTRGVVGVDCEFVGVGRKVAGVGGQRSVLARMSIVSYSGEVLVDTFVQVEDAVADFRMHVTGLTQDHLDSGIPFAEARELAQMYFKDRVVVGHSIHHDFKALHYSHPPEMVRDTQTCKQLHVADLGRSLKALCEHHLGKKIQDGVHDSVEDARIAVDLYRLVEDTWDSHCPVNDNVLAPAPAAPHLRGASVALSASGLGANQALADHFERQAKASTSFSRNHYLRVSRTLRVLPFELRSPVDLDRPELHAIGRGKVRATLEKLLGTHEH